MAKINMDEDYIAKARHSIAHVLAKAVCLLYDDVKLAIGPAIENGLYYDFDLPHTLKEADFEKIEQKMTEIINNNEDFVMRQLDSPKDLLKDQPYKLELIEEFDEAYETITAYETGHDFFDLCAGPHVENTKELRNWGFKLASVAGAYWRGDVKRPMLQRVYVHAFPTRQELKKHLQFLEEAKKRDHRVLGNTQELFFFDETAPGMPYWLPKGLTLYNTLLNFSRKVHKARGYQEIAGPQLNHRALWETSGHWEHYQDDMFTIHLPNEQVFALKPMNCPNALITFGRKNRSYKELPLRYMETSLLHRNEASGTLHGLLRVQTFRQDDSHNFITEDQIFDEINSILDIVDYLYSVFGLPSRAVLSTRPEEGFLGEIATWDQAEDSLKKVLNARYGENYDVNEGDGAFYGPKIDILVKDILNREWQLCTIQLDFQLAAKFNVHYTDKDGRQKQPVVIHRALFGSLERFIGILIEQFAAKFPFWLSPWQIGVVPVHPEHNDYAQKVTATLQEAGYRVIIDTSDGTMGNKIKSFRHELMPYIIILGEKEAANGTISLRTRSGKQINDIPQDKFMQACKKMESEHMLELIEEI